MNGIHSPEYVVGIDIGGTNIRLAVAEASNVTQVLARRQTDTPSSGNPEDVLDLLASEVSECMKDAGVRSRTPSAVGCSVPGILDGHLGVVQLASNLKWRNVPLARLLNQRLGTESVIENDVRAAALAEHVHGAGRGRSSLAYLTVSTGLSVGIVVDGKVLRGHHSAAGEIAYFIPDAALVDEDWMPQGCLEAHAGGIGLSRRWAAHRGAPEGLSSAVEVFRAAEAGDARAVDLVGQAATYLAQASLAICLIVDPEVLVLGGSIAQHQPLIGDRIRSVAASALPFEAEIVQAALGGDAPLTGALSIAAAKVRKMNESLAPVER